MRSLYFGAVMALLIILAFYIAALNELISRKTQAIGSATGAPMMLAIGMALTILRSVVANRTA